MSNDILMPDYENSILNLITSILKKYNVESKYKSLEKVDKVLEKNYQNVVLMILDGMGENILKNLSPDGFFYSNKVGNLTSVYPSTTAAAMNTYYSGKPPIESGWIAWSQYFKEFGRNIDLFPEKDSYTGEYVGTKNLKVQDIIGYKTVYEQIKEKNEDVKVFEVVPSYCSKRARMTMTADTVEEMCESVVTLCRNPEKKFILAYNDNPDGIIHKKGCYSKETKEFVLKAEREVEKMLSELKGTNTLVILSADHGHQDIGNTVDILDLDEIQDCLILPPTLESRVVGFFVKSDKKEKFVREFNRVFEGKFVLYSKEELLESNLLGFGVKHRKVADFIGDFVAVSVSDWRILLGTHLARDSKRPDEKLSTHCRFD